MSDDQIKNKGIPNALVAICPHRPMNFGHVGFGYEYPNGSWCIGAVEGENWQGVFNGFWSTQVSNFEEALRVFASMKQYGAEYDRVKLLEIHPDASPSPRLADQAREWVRQQPYSVIDRNCMDSTYDILRSYTQAYAGGFLPKPEDNWFPNDWYKNIHWGREFDLVRSDVAEFTPEELDAKVILAKTPEWRIQSNPQYILPRKGEKF